MNKGLLYITVTTTTYLKLVIPVLMSISTIIILINYNLHYIKDTIEGSPSTHMLNILSMSSFVFIHKSYNDLALNFPNPLRIHTACPFHMKELDFPRFY